MSFKVTGAKEIQRALYDLSTREAQKVGRAALRKAARAILVAARERVPVDEGRLKKALMLKVDRGRNRSWLFANVLVKKLRTYRARKTDRQSTVKGKLGPARYDYQIGTTPEVYGAFVEFGTRDQPPRPYMRPAWDSQGGQTALDLIGREIGEGIERAAGKKV